MLQIDRLGLGRLSLRAKAGQEMKAMAFPKCEEQITTVFQLAERLRQQAPIQLLDVREPDEFALCHIEGARSVPLLDLLNHVRDLDPAVEIVVCCHTGNKSLEAVKYLSRRGFQRVSNLEGGIDLWALAIDRSFPIYGRDPEKSNGLKKAFWEKVEQLDQAERKIGAPS